MRVRVDLQPPSAENAKGGVDGDASTRRPGALRWVLRRVQWIERSQLHSSQASPPFYTVGLMSALGIALVYALALTHYLFALHDSFSTFAEDLGIMDQTLWNTIHGHFMRQTICNPIGDQNCLGIVSRFAIHFEPILALLAPLYLIVPSVKTLVVLQVFAVASGVVPVYLLAARRLHHAAWGVAFVLLYLLHPSLQAVTLSVFHPESLAAPILLWTFYCLAVRRYRTALSLCIVALLCKETLALDVCMLGIYVALILRRRTAGIALIFMSLATLALALTLMHRASPLGYSPVAPRLSGLYQQPLQTIGNVLLDPQRRAYPVRLLAPVGFLPLLSPWTLLIAIPSFLINIFSSNPLMFSGGYQYNADIVPVLIAASIDGLAWALPVVQRSWRRLAQIIRSARFSRVVPSPSSASRLPIPSAVVVGVVVLATILPLSSFRSQAGVSQAWAAFFRPQSHWPAVTSHDTLGAELMQGIPASSSVSAQSMLAPHLSERYRVYQFPSGESNADYIVLDVSRGSFYPFSTSADYIDAVAQLLHSCTMEVTAAQDGYLLLHRVAAQQSADTICEHPLPQAFYSFAYASSPPNMHNTSAIFAGSLQLIGYTLNTTRVHVGQTPLVVTTYWKAQTPPPLPLIIVVTISRNGKTLLEATNSWTQHWLPPSQWEPGQTVRVQTWPIYLGDLERGNLTIGVQVAYGIPDAAAAPLVAADASILPTVAASSPRNAPATLSGDGTTVQFASITAH
ncbi:MAG: DUF2079 domain-containing protein [Ktedonobacterales bacterium]